MFRFPCCFGVSAGSFGRRDVQVGPKEEEDEEEDKDEDEDEDEDDNDDDDGDDNDEDEDDVDEHDDDDDDDDDPDDRTMTMMTVMTMMTMMMMRRRRMRMSTLLVGNTCSWSSKPETPKTPSAPRVSCPPRPGRIRALTVEPETCPKRGSLLPLCPGPFKCKRNSAGHDGKNLTFTRCSGPSPNTRP